MGIVLGMAAMNCLLYVQASVLLGAVLQV